MTTKMDLQIAKPITLPSGLVLQNRLVNAATTEQMADSRTFLPTQAMNDAYAAWAEGGWGMQLTGNVQVDTRYLGGPNDTALPEPEGETAALLESWRAWAEACKTRALADVEGEGVPTIVQINHPGRQTPMGAGTRGLFAKSLAPSAVPLNLGSGIIAKVASAIVFGTPKEMSVDEIGDVVKRFANGARLAAEAGFDGVQIHAAHGYLLAQFLGAKTNLRTDAYGGSPTKRAKIVVDIVHAMRAATPKGFTVGIKLNSVDHQSEADLKDCIEQLEVITGASVDFLEISGGTYEDPTMFIGTKDRVERSDRTKARESFFLEFAKAIRHNLPGLALIVTGGFRSRLGMELAVSEGGCDMVGLGRPAVLNPTLPKNTVFNPEVKDADAKLYVKRIEAPWIMRQISPAVGAGAESAWYSKQIARMAQL